MRQIIRLFVGLFLCLSLGLASSVKAVDEMNIYDTIANSSKHYILLAAVNEFGFADALKAKGANTFFAPTDEAFKKLTDAELQKLIANKELFKKTILAHWVEKKSLKADDLKALAGINGFAISVNDGLKIGEAKVIKADISCVNGIVHFIDTVLIVKE